ncbi:MAG: 2-oxoglutarate and iron-dependent oxygenase domain-containing protein [Myxococcota bacterium]
MTSTPTDLTAIVPVIDVAPLAGDLRERRRVARRIGDACRAHGFFYVTGHGVDEALTRRLETLSRAFFARDLDSKRRIAMAHGGRAWRGYFAVGDELTSGVPDRKEGLYLGTELPPEHPLVRARTPMHGANLFPDLPGFRETVLAYIDAVGALGHRLVAAIALSLELEEDYFERRYTAEPLVLFRIFNYPVPTPESVGLWGVGEHTDYGLLTLLLQDDNEGLEIRTDAGWLDAKPIRGSFVCNIGDMLDRMTRGLYRSTPHRVRASARRDRLSFPLFFDPGFHARVRPIEGLPPRADDRESRWDGQSVHAFEGSYGEYLVAKVSRVFPQLSGDLA